MYLQMNTSKVAYVCLCWLPVCVYVSWSLYPFPFLRIVFFSIFLAVVVVVVVAAFLHVVIVCYGSLNSTAKFGLLFDIANMIQLEVDVYSWVFMVWQTCKIASFRPQTTNDC